MGPPPPTLAVYDDPYNRPSYRSYGVGVLMLVFACHAIDRSLPNILVEPVRQEFNLSDSQLGLFTGLAFALSFSAAVLPAGYLGDRVNRRNFLSLAVLAWSALTGLCGFTRHFLYLVIARFGVGAAEATAAPLVLPMLSDMVHASRRAFAIGVLYMSNPIGLLIANLVGGYIAAEYGWRTAFLAAAAPGLAIAVLVATTLREPRRGRSEYALMNEHSAPRSGGEAFRFIRRTPAVACLILGCSVVGLLNIAVAAWMSSFFIRIHGASLKEAGTILGLGAGLCGVLSSPMYGWLADRLARRDHRWPLWLITIGLLVSMVFFIGMLFAPTLALSVTCYVVAFLLFSGYTPPLYSVLINHTPTAIRSSTMSILQLTTNFVGFGLGPLVTGMLSDLWGGGKAIRYALASLSVLFALGAALLFLASVLLGHQRRQPSDAIATPGVL